jgi:hypothetical protein
MVSAPELVTGTAIILPVAEAATACAFPEIIPAKQLALSALAFSAKPNRTGVATKEMVARMSVIFFRLIIINVTAQTVLSV